MPIWECVHHLLHCATPLFVHFKGYTKMAFCLLDMFTQYKKKIQLLMLYAYSIKNKHFVVCFCKNFSMIVTL